MRSLNSVNKVTSIAKEDSIISGFMNPKFQNNQYLIALGTVVGFVIFIFFVFTYIPNAGTNKIKKYILSHQISESSEIRNQEKLRVLKECIDDAKEVQRSSYIALNSTYTRQEGFPNARKWNSKVIIDTEGQNSVIEAISLCEKK